MSALEPALVLVVLAALTTPHLAGLRRVGPPAAITVWLLALALRAVAAVGLATLALIGLADVGVVKALLAWCWHEVLPDVPSQLGFAEHPVAHAVVAVPAVALAASLVWLGLGLARGRLAVRRKLSAAIGPGPLGSTIVPDKRVVVAVTSVGRGRVIVSDQALDKLDSGELAAGLVHELAHLRRRHRPLLIVGAVLGALGRPLPGTRAAERELRFHIERDADRYTVRALDDPLALASAICKVVRSAAPATRGLAAFGVHGAGETRTRLDCLLGGGRRRGSARLEGVVLALALVLPVVIAVALAGFGHWLAGAAPPAALAAALSCAH